MLMLGTSDFQSMHPHTAWHAAQGIATLVTAIRNAPIEPGMPTPPIGIPRGPIAAKFTGAADKSASTVDGIHLDAGQHQTLGRALAQVVAGLPGVLSAPAA